MEKSNIIPVRLYTDKLKSNFDALSQFGAIWYPMKSESNTALLMELVPWLNKDPHGFSVKTLDHYRKLQKLKVPVSKMCLIDVLAEPAFIKFLYGEGVRNFVFDDLDALKSFTKYADLTKCRIHMRLNINEVLEDIELIHLGASVEDMQAMLYILQKKGCEDYGISFYVQSELETAPTAFEDVLNFIVKTFCECGLKFINIGGSKSPADLQALKPRLDEIAAQLGVYFVLEPGRNLVGDTMDMASRIFRVKQAHDKTVVILKNGIYGGLLDEKLYGKQFDLRLVDKDRTEIKIERMKTESANYEFILYGQSSDSGDCFGSCFIPKGAADLLRAGTDVIIKDVGTYCLEFVLPIGGDIQFEFSQRL